MKRNIFVLTVVGGLALGGCSSFEAQVAPTQQYKSVVSNRAAAVSALSAASVCCRDLSVLPYKELQLGSDQLMPIDAASPVYQFAEGKSYFVAYRLPVNSGDLRITVEGIMDQTVFSPSALLLDSRFKVTRKLGSETFKYEPAKLMNGDRMEAVFSVDRSQIGNPNNESYLLIYTDESKLGEAATAISPSKQMAKSLAVVDYGAKDLVIPHSPWGVLRLSVEDLGGIKSSTSNYYKPTYDVSIPQSAPAMEPEPNKLMVAPMAAATAATAATAAPAKTATVTMMAETEAFYKAQIEKAVKNGDIDKAMQLVSEAERAGSTKAKSVFIDAVKSTQKTK